MCKTKFRNKNKVNYPSFPDAYVIYEKIAGASNEYLAVPYNYSDNDCLVRQKDHIIVKTSIKEIREAMNRHNKKILIMSINEKCHFKNYRIVEKWI
jgi:ssDNA-binding replication factor A large subunit